MLDAAVNRRGKSLVFTNRKYEREETMNVGEGKHDGTSDIHSTSKTFLIKQGRDEFRGRYFAYSAVVPIDFGNYNCLSGDLISVLATVYVRLDPGSQSTLKMRHFPSWDLDNIKNFLKLPIKPGEPRGEPIKHSVFINRRIGLRKPLSLTSSYCRVGGIGFLFSIYFIFFRIRTVQK